MVTLPALKIPPPRPPSFPFTEDVSFRMRVPPATKIPPATPQSRCSIRTSGVNSS
jgi:hypothetical protein